MERNGPGLLACGLRLFLKVVEPPGRDERARGAIRGEILIGELCSLLAHKFLGEGSRLLGEVWILLLSVFRLSKPSPLSSPAAPPRLRSFPGPGRGPRWVGLVSGRVSFLEAGSPWFVPQFPWAVKPTLCVNRASESHDQKPQVFFHVCFLLSRTRPSPWRRWPGEGPRWAAVQALHTPLGPRNS